MVSPGSVAIGCGAAKFQHIELYHLVVVCHYHVTGGTEATISLRDGETHATDIVVFESYDTQDSLQVQGCQ